MLTLGVEEEFLLLRPDGSVAPVAHEVLRYTATGDRVVPEFMAYQIETATEVCSTVDELRSDLVRLRRRVSLGAQRLGVRLVSAGFPPFRVEGPPPFTNDARYLAIARRFPSAAALAGGACACQVHVGVPDRDLAATVLTRLRPWLATLLTMTANSPVAAGVDVGWNSHRYRSLLRWPTFRPPAVWTNADRYDRTVQTLVDCGAADGPAGIYLLARLSARYPTIEVRVADACLTVEDTVLLAAVVRALVATLIDDIRLGRAAPPPTAQRVGASLLAAARGRLDVAPALQRSMLLDTIWPALTAFGDAEEVQVGLRRLGRLGSGADRQRALFRHASSPQEFVAGLAEASVPALSDA